MRAPVSVSEKYIAIGIQEISWSQASERAGKRGHDPESLSERRRCKWRLPDRRYLVEQNTKGEFGIGFTNRVEPISLEDPRFEYAGKVAVVCKQMCTAGQLSDKRLSIGI